MAVPLIAWVWESNSHVTTFRKHILSVRLHITDSNSFSRERFVMVKSCCSETRSSWGWYSKLEKRRFWVIFSETSRHAPTLHETEFGRFDTSRFDSLKSFRDIVKVDSIHVESRFDSTPPLCSQLFSGSSGAKTAIPVSQWRCFQAATVMKTLSIRDPYKKLDKTAKIINIKISWKPFLRIFAYDRWSFMSWATWIFKHHLPLRKHIVHELNRT